MKITTTCSASPATSLPLALFLLVGGLIVPMVGCGPDNSTEKVAPATMTPEQLEEERTPVKPSGA
ncbi:hypothetical protein [Allorhodopirellula heiligendammensis]|uniref:Uncharacterized protein n=1 Tax=Allorhodopirellula heiligendammensis TaxID=2714739 RepID=A0A5C6BHK0_9BACT|nr:hypothetical protein [Allorhodopirellula heiligendammensis]TWU11011.1 hypothetical protein Poly21_49180 [Allorhodopirellula heiligendammensis]